MQNNSNSTYIKARELLYLLIFSLLLTACGAASPSGTQTAATTATITLEELPAGVGRGFPIVEVPPNRTQGSGVQPGMLAPDFAFIISEGGALNLQALRGRPVLINFWATWCGPCRIEMPELVRATQEHPDLVLLAVNVQEEHAPVSAFAEDFRMTLPVLMDSEGELRNRYEVRAMPTSIFIDREGAVQVYWAGLLTPAQLADFLKQIL